MPKQAPEAVRRLSRERAPQFYDRMKHIPSPASIEVGQIWSTHSRLNLPGLPESVTEAPRLVTVLTGAGPRSEEYGQITVAPVSVEVWAATDYDLLVPETEGPLTYRFMVEVWNETPVLKAHLRAFLGSLSDRAVAALRSLHVARLVDEALPAAVRQWVGLPVMDEHDRRVTFQQEEIDAVTYLANAATAAVFSEVSAPEVKPVLNPLEKKVLRLKPSFGRLADLLTPKRAYAASASPGADCTFTLSSGQNSLVLELLERRRESLVYLVVRKVLGSYAGRSCVVSLVVADKTIRSEVVQLQQDAKIDFALVTGFDRKNIEVEIEFMEPAEQ